MKKTRRQEELRKEAYELIMSFLPAIRKDEVYTLLNVVERVEYVSCHLNDIEDEETRNEFDYIIDEARKNMLGLAKALTTPSDNRFIYSCLTNIIIAYSYEFSRDIILNK